VITYSPKTIYVDFAVNDTSDASGSRANGWAPAAEALIRRLRLACPNAEIVCGIYTRPTNYSYNNSGDFNARDKWIRIAAAYGLALRRWDTYLETLMGTGYNDAAVEAYLFAVGNVHPNDAGHMAAYNMLVAQPINLVSNNPEYCRLAFIPNRRITNTPQSFEMVSITTAKPAVTGLPADPGGSVPRLTTRSTGRKFLLFWDRCVVWSRDGHRRLGCG